MKDTPRLPNGDLDLEADWQCEGCGNIIKLKDTFPTWSLNLVCNDCAQSDAADNHEFTTPSAPPSGER